ncbi:MULTISPECIES: ABC transporter ATP-binding protein [Gordonia]|uniref:ABC transporter ATP-binding protein n=1 Tax=Gordonia alkanivorans CGMCC 6845 TaxID=1423140 RepID=W9D648_9ACTN|nr:MULTISPECIES: ABC transporter ATP-binding protein [Gordonia]ETA04643.1 ABC transporter ATP-binding protein [Gordonia alkanivorans CGMCC 6845]MDH3008749.1 ABC transporter ATP-binding protein [Gordonia alkanivorans]MDH3017682.1 ABC transporter ATP-binding protein [Gordonia alkanivorans]MDH3022032.1 ABC transporter ATP-binding protein [Gordonia alkanivorans]MDH3025960.1 ABC transporter ATP-binding protein [Gordonia alkanivorans]
MTTDHVLEVRNLSVRYGPALALHDVSFDVRAGSVTAVLGTNGAGKTTLARALCGLVRPSAGSILFDGTDLVGRRADQIARAGLMYLPEGRGIFPGLSVGDNLRMATVSHPREQRSENIDRAVEYFPVLAERLGQRAGTLSGGEQQMLSLARALALRPPLVIADEMSLGLAPKMVDMVFEGLAAAAAAGTSILMIEQFVHRSLAMADSALVIRRGGLAWQGPADGAAEAVEEHYVPSGRTSSA